MLLVQLKYMSAQYYVYIKGGFSSFIFQQILNHCIDDIENLVIRTKRSAEAWKKLKKKKGKIKRKLESGV